jgi:hypothetical protein
MLPSLEETSATDAGGRVAIPYRLS